MLFLGDVHGRWEHLAHAVQSRALTRDTIVQVGDFGVGFGDPTREAGRLQALNGVLETHDLTLHAIRGNHDDPRYFRDHRHDLSHIRFVGDYETLALDGFQIMCAGGATSVDRRPRQRQNLGWWPDEAFQLPADDLVDAPDIVVTHSAPAFCPPLRPGRLVMEFVRYDPALLTDLQRERDEHTALFNALDRRRLRLWVYGHFHQAFTHQQEQVIFRGLPELGLFRLD
jgi:predicted phosphodiesterase